MASKLSKKIQLDLILEAGRRGRDLAEKYPHCADQQQGYIEGLRAAVLFVYGENGTYRILNGLVDEVIKAGSRA